MVDVDVVFRLGSSVDRGLEALLSDVPAADIARWFGSTSYAAAIAGGYPATVTVPGVEMLTLKMPFASFVTRTVNDATVLAAETTLTYTGGASGAEAKSWVFIQTEGLLRKVVSDNGSLLTVSAVWGVNIANGGDVIFLPSSHSVDGASTGTTVTKHADTDDFGSIDDKFVTFPAGASGHVIRRIVSHTANAIVVDDAVTVADGACMIVLDGADSADDLASIGTDPILQPLQIHLNNAPCLFTGYDYPNYDLQPGIAAPTLAAATINADLEMYWQFRSRFGGTIYGLNVPRDSSTLSPYPIGSTLRPLLHGWQHDITDFSFHPSTENSLYTGFVNSVEALRTLIAADGNTMRVRAFVVLLAENDMIVSIGGTVRHTRVGANLALLFDAVRTIVDDPELPCIAVGPGSADYPLQGADSEDYPYRAAVYEQLEQLVMEDTNAEFVDLRDEDRYTFTDDNLHLDAQSQINLGVDIPLAYDRIVAGNTATAVDLCNLALSHIGESSKVTSLDTTIDTSAQARHCARFYPIARDWLLEKHSWGFATRRVELVPVAAAAYTREEWTYAYEAPRKMAGAIAVLAPGSRNDAPTLPFVKESDPAGRDVIYTDVENAVIRYNRYVTNTRRFSVSFGQALTWLLASHLAGPITKDQKAAADCLVMMRQFLPQAEVHDSNQRKTEHQVEAPWMPGGLLPDLSSRWDPNAHG